MTLYQQIVFADIATRLVINVINYIYTDIRTQVRLYGRSVVMITTM